MLIRKITGTTPTIIANALESAIASSRFTADMDFAGRAIKLRNVRLRAKKPYCGNHPNACEGVGQRHARRDYLEGADWVEFNDLVNDTLDRLKVSASAASAVCIIRKGTRRRIRYGSFKHNPMAPAWHWNKDETEASAYQDYCGIPAPRSDFPFGTPGIHTGKNYFAVGHEEHQDHDHGHGPARHKLAV